MCVCVCVYVKCVVSKLERVTEAALQALVDHNMAQVTEALAQTKPTVHPSPPGQAQVGPSFS